MALVLLHTFWGVIFFDACEKRRYGCLGLVVASHLLTSGLVSWTQTVTKTCPQRHRGRSCHRVWGERIAGTPKSRPGSRGASHVSFRHLLALSRSLIQA